MEEIPYGEDNLDGSRVQIPEGFGGNGEVSRIKSSIIPVAGCDCTVPYSYIIL